MAKGDDTWDYDALHRWLWEQADGEGVLKMAVTDIADIFYVDRSFMSRVVSKFEAEGRLERLSGANRATRLRIVDPDFYTPIR